MHPGTVPIKQAPRKFSDEIEAQVKKKIKKLLKAKFIRPIQHPTWLVNIVLVKKKNRQIRCCVDFHDLNKAYPKDDLPLSDMDRMVDAIASPEQFSFIDSFSGCNQIRMALRDEEKTAFRTLVGNFFYVEMRFVLKNVGATY